MRKVYEVEIKNNIQPNTPNVHINENALDWNYWIQIQNNDLNPWGYQINEARDYQGVTLGSTITYSFKVIFSAKSFEQSGDISVMLDALAKDSILSGMKWGLDPGNVEVSHVASKNCEQPTTSSESGICGDVMKCSEGDLGNVTCFSPCSTDFLLMSCGEESTCTQETGKSHVCACEKDVWWKSGGDWGNGNSPCKPVLENWLIIVIAVIAFLVLVLLIIGVIYCCLNGCVCPCACACCDESGNESEYIYKPNPVFDSGKINESYTPDNNSSKSLFKDKEEFTENEQKPVWYINTTQGNTLNQDASAYAANTFPKEDSVRNRDDSKYGTANRHDKYSSHDRRRKRHSKDSRSHKESRRPRKKHDSKRNEENLEAEIDRLQREIQKQKDDLDAADNSTLNETVLAPTNTGDSLIGDVIAELKQHNQIKKINQDLEGLSDEDVDNQPSLKKYESRTVLVPELDDKKSLSNTLKDRWRVPQLSVKPLKPSTSDSVMQVESNLV